MATPADGIYYGVPFAEYQQWNAINQSTLKAGLRGGVISSAHMRHAMDNPREETDALLFGKAFDTAMFDPAGFAANVVAAPDVDRRTKAGKAEAAAFDAANAGKIVIDADDFAAIRRMADALNAHPSARELGAAAGLIQGSMIWTDPETGVRVKGSPDKVIGSTLVDLKTTRAAHPVAVAKAIDEYGYHIQAACYAEGLSILGHSIDECLLIFVEKTGHHGVSVVRLGPRTLETGYRKYRDLLGAYAECTKTGVWPGYSEEIQEIELKDWALDPVDEEPSL